MFDDLPTELNHALVDVLYREHHAGARGEGFNLSASVFHFRQEGLHGGNLVCHIEMHVWVDLVEESGGELLERVDMHLNVRDTDSEALSQGSSFILEATH